MIDVKEAEELILQRAVALPSEPCPLAASTGRVLREDVYADRDIPPFNRAMMDGIALAFSAIEQGTRRFRIEDTLHAGRPPASLADRASGCIQIMTGSVVPNEADCIVPFEDISIDDGWAQLSPAAPLTRMQHIHRQGADCPKGGSILAEGCILTSPKIGILASVGKDPVQVAILPKIGIVATGDELVEVNENPLPHQIRMSNSHGLVSALRGFAHTSIRRANDNPDDLHAALKAALDENDVLIVTGGVSAGKRDHVPGTLADLGVAQVLHKVRQRPGKPLWFGVTQQGKPVFALPGNPVATLVSVHRYVIPFLARSMGARQAAVEYATLSETIEFALPLTYFPPVALEVTPNGGLAASPVTYHGSGDLFAMSNSDGFVELHPADAPFSAGRTFRLYRWR